MPKVYENPRPEASDVAPNALFVVAAEDLLHLGSDSQESFDQPRIEEVA
jgi:hypothetical protein